MKTVSAQAAWKLNNNEAKEETLEILWVERRRSKVKYETKKHTVSEEAEKDSKMPRGILIYNLIKSLILAQDERWRHA